MNTNPSIGDRPSRRVTINEAQRLYVIAFDGGVSCLGFDNARGHANQIAERLRRPELAFDAQDDATLDGYTKYMRAIQAWGSSSASRHTYFDPGTAPEAARVLERCRNEGNKVRLVLGDTATGESWLDEYDVVGTLGRSSGPLRVPLLIEEGEDGGGAILTTCLLCVIDWRCSRALYRHPAYRVVDLAIAPSGDDQRPWAVRRREETVAQFDDIGKAAAYLAFMRGLPVEPTIFR
ncbi:MAG: hypothetical protein IV094_25220 [Vitreoscilla sp.]|jgi:hypothetical protein|nr:hypothetical protein [Vitreoscilla sp.]